MTYFSNMRKYYSQKFTHKANHYKNQQNFEAAHREVRQARALLLPCPFCTFYIIFLLFSTDCDGLESISQGRSRQSTWRFQAKTFAKEISFTLVSNETWWLCYLQETREKVHHSKSPGHKSSQLTVKGNFTLRNPNMVHDPGTPCQWWSNLCLGRCCGCSQDSIRRFHCALYQGDNLASKKVFFSTKSVCRLVVSSFSVNLRGASW